MQLKLCPHSLDRVLSFFSRRRIGTPPPPHQQASVPPPPLMIQRGVHTRSRERGGAVRIPTRGQTMWYSRYICTLCVSLSQWTADKLLWVSFRTYAAASQPRPSSIKHGGRSGETVSVGSRTNSQSRAACSGLNARNSFNLYVGDSTVFSRKNRYFRTGYGGKSNPGLESTSFSASPPFLPSRASIPRTNWFSQGIDSVVLKTKSLKIKQLCHVVYIV